MLRSRIQGRFDSRSLPRNRRLPAIYRWLNEEQSEAALGDEHAREPRVAMVEASLFAADEPLTPRKLAAAAGLSDGNEARRLVKKLQALYEAEGSAFEVEEIAGGFQLLTRGEFHPWLIRSRRSGHDLRLSSAARETLAIIAYRQPIIRADVEAVRGVQVSDVLHQLMEKGLVRIVGRDDSLGRPVLYGTSKKFLQHFGLKSLRELPLNAQFRRKETQSAEEPESAGLSE